MKTIPNAFQQEIVLVLVLIIYLLLIETNSSQKLMSLLRSSFAYSDDALKRIGGSKKLDSLVIAYCQKIEDDPRLSEFFGNFEEKNLAVFQKLVVTVALVAPKSAQETETMKNRVLLRHYQLFQLGFDETHFDILAKHFSRALHECIVSEDVIELSAMQFRALRPIFQVDRMPTKGYSNHSKTRESVREQIARVRRNSNAHSIVANNACGRTL